MINIEAYFKGLKATWLNRILENPSKNWSIFGNSYIEQLGGKEIVTTMDFTEKTQMPLLQSLNFTETSFWVLI